MKKILLSLLTVVTMTFAGGSASGINPILPDEPVKEFVSKIYVGAAYTKLNNVLETDTVKLLVEQGAVTLIGGYEYNEFIAIEGRYSFSGSENNILIGGQDDFGDVWGIYIKPQYYVTEEGKIYALLGYGETEGYEDGGSFQYGLGMALELTDNVELFGDVVRVYTSNLGNGVDGSTNAYTLGLNYKF